MKQEFVVIIPARYASTRLPGKPLELIGDRPLLQHVYENAKRSNAKDVYIATDSEKIQSVIGNITENVLLTSELHNSGTERIAEACDVLSLDDGTIVVNVQGDEFGLDPGMIDQVAEDLANNPDTSIATLCEPITNHDELHNEDVVKVEMNSAGFASRFYRLPDQEPGEVNQHWRHLGIYAYRAGFVRRYINLEPTTDERELRLEQLRAMQHGYQIFVGVASGSSGIGVDTAEDLEKARQSYLNNS